jgi:hypothetical protein
MDGVGNIRFEVPVDKTFSVRLDLIDSFFGVLPGNPKPGH